MAALRYLERATSGTTKYNGKCITKVRQADADLIGEYVIEKQTSSGITEETAKVCATYLCIFSRETDVSFTELNTKDVMVVIARFRKSMKPNSLRRFLSIFREFVLYLNTEGHNTAIDVQKVNAIKPPQINTQTKKASEMLSGDDIIQLIGGAKNSRDRAIISMIYEGSLRPIEAASATWEDIVFDQYGAQFTTNCKTGRSRYIRLIWSAPYLLEYKNDYQGEITPESPMFLSLRGGDALTVSGVKQVITQAAKRSGMKKHVHAYLLRHSRITAMVSDEVPDSIIKLQAWGDISSRMLATYAHISQKDMDRILLSRAGIVVEDVATDASLKARQCQICGTANTPTDRFCRQCGNALSADAVLERDDEIAFIESQFPDMSDAERLKVLSILRNSQQT